MSVAQASLAAKPGRGFFAAGPWMRFRRVAVAVVACIAVAGCAGPTRDGATFEKMTKTIGAPKDGQSRIVVLRDKAFPGIFDVGWEVRIDDAPMGDLKTGTFVYRDRAPGTHKLTFARPGDFSRASHHTFTTPAGRTHFFRLEMNDKGKAIQASAIAAGLSGLLISSAISAGVDERGLFDFTPLDGQLAREAMADMRLAP